VESASLQGLKLHDDITAQVVEAFTRWQSARDQVATARQALQDAEAGLRLTSERKSFAVGAVLEDIQAQQDLTRARDEYLRVVAELNIRQYALLRAIGRLR
jgi:outer membrane protein